MRKMRRRDVFLAAATAGMAATLGPAVSAAAPASSRPEARKDKRRPQYQPNSAEIQTFYRVNRYPSQ
jgi:hypothetical protein